MSIGILKCVKQHTYFTLHVHNTIKMSWVPPDLASTCTPFTTLTTCQPPTFMFLQMITQLFARSQDAKFSSLLTSNYMGTTVPPPTPFKQAKIETFFGTNSDETQRTRETQGTNVFDFIVIGAGSAGCVVANRLTEIPDWNVLLLEAGIEQPEVSDIPSFAPMLRSSNIDWQFRTMPQPQACTARPEGRCVWPRGRVMGGTSVINYMIYLRGGPKDFDEWADLGNPGWSYKDILPYFLRTEKNNNPDIVDNEYHGFTGDWPVEYFPYQDDNVFYMLNAIEELGLSLFDQNALRQVGGSLMQHSTNNGERVSANVAFIRPIRGVRKNLQVETQAVVTRILIDPLKKTAYGVEYTQNSQLRRAYARKEVILAGGVLNSPKILMLSGVGPRRHLQEMRIPVIQDLNVGSNLHDHTTIDGVLYALSNLTATSASQEEQQQNLHVYQNTRRGPLAGTATLQVNAFLQTKYEKEVDRPDIQFSIDASNVANFVTDPILTDLTNVLPIAYYDGLAIRPVLLTPKSRGYVRLNSTHPVYGPPLIYANTFTESIDLARVIDGVRQALSLASTKTFRDIGARLVTNRMPACQAYVFDSDEYWVCVATSYTTTLYHPVGTCKMARRSDRDAVVNHELKVYGINRLRVIDGSIMPIVPRANTNTATLMIAEKGCDMVKKEWLGKKSEKKKFLHSFDSVWKILGK